MRIVLLATTVLGLSGCMTQMVKPGASPEQVAQDQRECSYEARRATAGIINGFQAGWEKASLERECLEVRGYRRQ